MSEVERIKRYIARTEVKQPKRYDMNLAEGMELSWMTYTATSSPLEIIYLAFNYGRAKGYRAAKAEARKSIS